MTQLGCGALDSMRTNVRPHATKQVGDTEDF